jgi:hypothetical protein
VEEKSDVAHDAFWVVQLAKLAAVTIPKVSKLLARAFPEKPKSAHSYWTAHFEI